MGEIESQAFHTLREKLGQKPLLQAYNPKRETELNTDASARGFAAILLQNSDDLKYHLAYAIIRRTNEPEKSYHSSKLE